MEYVDLSSIGSDGPDSTNQVLYLNRKRESRKEKGRLMTRELGVTMWVAASVMVGVLASPRRTNGDDTKATAKPGVDAKSAFARIKTLAGTWKSQTSDEQKAEHATDKVEDHKRDSSVIYKLTGADTALMETQFPGSNHEMVSVYHLDGDDLRMTHYCAAGNQPRVKLDRANSKPDELIFVFDGGTNLDPQKDMHIHGVKITFHDDGKVTSAWEGYMGGKKAMTTSFLLTRQSDSRPEHKKTARSSAASSQ
jgi:hypothetical protein